MNEVNLPFSEGLKQKIQQLAHRRVAPGPLGAIDSDSPLWLAPMSAICDAPFRLLMENLGAGLTVSELISCHGINYGNEKTQRMLRIDPREKRIGIQLFGEEPQAMAEAAKLAQSHGPQFIDINMGCPVRKVVSKGSGSALMRDPSKLGEFFRTIKSAIDIPLTIKIRTGWDESSINAQEVIHIAHNEGVNWVAVHGRTRSQAYKGLANWELLEELGVESPLPIIGNGDLHTQELVQTRLEKTKLPALMLGRGPLRNPFLFLESYLKPGEESPFTPLDYWEIIQIYFDLLVNYCDRERIHLIQLRKIIVWFLAGMKGVSPFRQVLFDCSAAQNVLSETFGFLKNLHDRGEFRKSIDSSRPFMQGGHG